MHLKKIIKTKTICLCLGFFAYVSAYSQPFGGGSGTQQDPYLISNKLDWQELADSVHTRGDIATAIQTNNWSYGKYFELTADITAPITFSIGKIFLSWDTDKRFQGYLDGKGFEIVLNLESAGSSDMYGALFAHTLACTIINLTVSGYVTGYTYVAGVVASNSNGSTYSQHRTLIKNVVSNVTVEGRRDTYIGGIVAVIGNATIENCINNGFLSVIEPTGFYSCRIGGIAGNVGGTTIISNSINLGSIYCGIANMHALGPGGNIGGIIGTGSNAALINNINYGFLRNINTGPKGGIGGIAGGCPFALATTISNNFNSGVVIGNGNVGCIVGNAGTNTVLENNHYDKQMCGEED